jgi:hypothetical protein
MVNYLIKTLEKEFIRNKELFDFVNAIKNEFNEYYEITNSSIKHLLVDLMKSRNIMLPDRVNDPFFNKKEWKNKDLIVHLFVWSHFQNRCDFELFYSSLKYFESQYLIKNKKEFEESVKMDRRRLRLSLKKEFEVRDATFTKFIDLLFYLFNDYSQIEHLIKTFLSFFENLDLN